MPPKDPIATELAEMEAQMRAVAASSAEANAIVARFGARLRELRAEKGWAQIDLARRSGISSTGISKSESTTGGNGPSLRALILLARALCVPITAFLEPPTREIGIDDVPGSKTGPRGPTGPRQNKVPGVGRPKAERSRAKGEKRRKKP